MKKPIFYGSGVALITPFNDSGINYNKLAELIEFQLKGGTDAIIVCGTTGEASTMSEDEHKAVLRFCIDKVQGRVPLIAGTGSNNTEKTIRLTKYAEDLGYDGALLVTPYYNKTTQKGLCEHYGEVAKAVSIPILLYNVPSRTGVSISLDTLKHLDSHYPNIVGIKEASGDVAFSGRIKAETDLVVYSGNDNVIIPIMAIGGVGVISVIANVFPEDVKSLCQDFLDGSFKEASNKFLGMLDIMDAMFIEVNPIPVKTAMNLLGFDVGRLRLPLCDMEDCNVEKLKIALMRYGKEIK